MPVQAALAAEEDEAQPSGRDFDDTASEASSAVSGMSAYGGSTTTAGTTSVTGSSGRPASTVGGKKPYKRKQRKVGRAHFRSCSEGYCRRHQGNCRGHIQLAIGAA